MDSFKFPRVFLWRGGVVAVLFMGVIALPSLMAPRWDRHLWQQFPIMYFLTLAYVGRLTWQTVHGNYCICILCFAHVIFIPLWLPPAERRYAYKLYSMTSYRTFRVNSFIVTVTAVSNK